MLAYFDTKVSVDSFANDIRFYFASASSSGPIGERDVGLMLEIPLCDFLSPDSSRKLPVNSGDHCRSDRV